MLVALLLVLAQSPDLAPVTVPGEGVAARFLLGVERLHPLGDRSTILKRLGHKLRVVRQEDPTQGALDLENASFRVRVPVAYQAAEPAGLMVWMDPDDKWVMPQKWGFTFDQLNMLVVAPNGAGGNQYAWNRAGLALAAVHELTNRYAIDPSRIYVAGRGNGGRMASRLALAWPDVFQGGIAIGGAAYFEAIPNPERFDASWPARLKRPSLRLLSQARKRSRYVFLAGDSDPKRSLCRLQALHMAKEEEFLHVAYLEIPRLGTDAPDAKWIRRAIDILDGPLSSADASNAR